MKIGNRVKLDRGYVEARSTKLFVLASVACSVACSVAAADGTVEDLGGPEGELESTGATDDAIINGSASTNDKVVQVLRDKGDGTVGLCTGTLLRSNIVLTAKHCVGTAGGVWRRHRITTRSGTVVEVTNQSQLREHPDADIALMRLDGDVSVNNSTNYWTGLHMGPVSGLADKNVECVGYGRRTCGGNDAGVQTEATLKVKSASSTTLNYLPNASGQVLSNGDSGGPCFLNGQVIGTTRTAVTDCSSANQAPVTTYADWIRDEMGDLLADYYTDFTNTATLSDFQKVDLPGSTNGPSAWSIDPNGMLLTGGVLLQTSGIKNPGTVLLLKKNVISDGLIAMDFGSSGANSAGIVFRYHDSSNYYRLSVWGGANGNQSGIYKVKNGGSTLLAGIPADSSLAYRFAWVFLDGKNISASIGGTSLEATDGDFMDGRVGLIVNGLSDVKFGYFDKAD